jgi:phage-related protein
VALHGDRPRVDCTLLSFPAGSGGKKITQHSPAPCEIPEGPERIPFQHHIALFYSCICAIFEYMVNLPYELKPIEWIGKSLEDLRKSPDTVRKEVGFALQFAQSGEKHPSAKPLKGFGGAGVLEIKEDFRGDTYRVVYTVVFAEVICVLHAFQKK